MTVIYGHDRRVQGGPPDVARRARSSPSSLLIGRRRDRALHVHVLMARSSRVTCRSRWVSRRRERMLDELNEHFIICGFGRIGRIIAREFARQKVPFVIIERNPERMQQAIDAGYLAVEADARSEEVLRRVAHRARARVHRRGQHRRRERLRRPDRAAAPAGPLHHRPRRNRRRAEPKLERAGADRVVSPYQIGGLQLAQTALRPAVVDFVQLATSSDNLELNMEQVQIGEGAPLAGQIARRRRACGSGSAWSSSASSAPTARWSSIRAPETRMQRRRPSRRARPARRTCASSKPPPASRRQVARCMARACSTDRGRIAAQIRESLLPGVHAFTARAGRPPGLGIVLVGDDPASEIYVREQGASREPSPACGSTSSACRRPRRSTSCWRSSARLNRSAAHDGILVQSPLPAGDGPRGRAARVRRDRPGQGRRRLSSGQRRPAGAGARAPGAVHAVRRHRDARSRAASPIAGRARRRHRPQRDRRQADGAAAAAARRDGDDLPLQDAGPRRGGAGSRHPGRRDRPGRRSSRATSSSRARPSSTSGSTA